MVKAERVLLSEWGEFELISRLESRFTKFTRDPSTILGIGDDTALIEPGVDPWALTTDSLIEDTHFTRELWPAESVGHRALAVNLSDLAAMGAAPKNALMSLALPPTLELRWFDLFLDGFARLAERYQVELIGGNLSRGAKLMVSVTVLGKVERGHAKLRSRARPGDLICVSGTLGDAGAGLELLLEPGAKKQEDWEASLIRQHLYPDARLELGLYLSKFDAVHSMMDLSDGLASDLGHIARASKVCLRIDLDKIPLSTEFRGFARARQLNAAREAARRGEDYELLFTLDEASFDKISEQAKAASLPPLTVIGRVEKEASGKGQVEFFEDGALLKGGLTPRFLHFKSS